MIRIKHAVLVFQISNYFFHGQFSGPMCVYTTHHYEYAGSRTIITHTEPSQKEAAGSTQASGECTTLVLLQHSDCTTHAVLFLTGERTLHFSPSPSRSITTLKRSYFGDLGKLGVAFIVQLIASRQCRNYHILLQSIVDKRCKISRQI